MRVEMLSFYKYFSKIEIAIWRNMLAYKKVFCKINKDN